jgi:hypothetical protein
MKQELDVAALVAKHYGIGKGKGEKIVLKTVPAQVQTVGFIAGAIKTEGQVVKAVYIQTVG